MLRKVLIVGVGGSGGKTLRVMHASLLRQLRAKGWTRRDLPECWQMLWVDTVATQQADNFAAPPLCPHEYLGLADPNGKYPAIINKLKASVPATEDLYDKNKPGSQVAEHLVGWAPENFILNPAKGAGQMRAIGRVIALAGIKSLSVNLRAKVDSLSGAQANTDQVTVSKMFGAETPGNEKPICLVVSSVAGGSGSGMFLDVVQTLRSVKPDDFGDQDAIFNILYTPDVFGDGADMVAPNSLAAITELISGVWREPSKTTSKTYEALSYDGGVLTNGFGPKCNFLVGRGNNYVPLGNQAEVYAAVGETLCALMTSYEVQDTMQMHVLQNVFLNSGNNVIVEDKLNLRESDTQQRWTQPFSSLGVSKLSVGGDRFAEYTSHLLARNSIEKLLWPNFADKGILKPGQDWLAFKMEQVTNLWPNFYQQTGFDHGDSASAMGEVTTALTDPQLTIQTNSFASQVVQEIEKAAGGQSIPSAQWVQAFGNFGRQQELFLKQRAEATNSMAKTWVAAIQDKLSNLASLYSSRYGYEITFRLLEQLSKYLTSVAQSVDTEAKKMESNFALVPAEISRRLVSQGNTKLLPTDAPIISARDVLAKGLEFKIRGDIFALANTLFLDYRDNYLSPLINALEGAHSQLLVMSNTTKLDNQAANPFHIAPRFGDPVPMQFKPAKTEILLIDPNEYQKELLEALQVILPQKDIGRWQEILVERGLLGMPLTDDLVDNLSKQNLIQGKKPWTPTSNRVADLSMIAGPAEFECESTYDGFQSGFATWLNDIDNTQDIAKLIRMSIYDFVKFGTAKQKQKREEDFKKAFANAAKFAAPYVDVDENVRNSIYLRIEDGLTPIVSKIPFTPKDDLFPALRQGLDAAGMWLPPVNGKSPSEDWFGDSSTSVIDFFTTNQKSMVPTVFRNLISHLEGSWTKNSGTAKAAAGFWNMRRARPLEECIPASRVYLQDMVTGWALLNLLDLRKLKVVPGRGYEVSIWDHEKEQYIAFPFPLLSNIDFSDDRNDKLAKKEILPMVLQTMALALVKLHSDINRNPEDFSAIRPYQVLQKIGANCSTNIEANKRFLNRWIASASKISDKAGDPKNTSVGASTDTSEQRAAITRETLIKTLASFNDYCMEESKKEWYEIGLRWEIRDLIRASLEQLIRITDDKASATASTDEEIVEEEAEEGVIDL